jgi:hypothetical protein
MHTPWHDLPQKMRQTILFGSGGDPIKMTYDDGLRQYSTDRPFEGVLPNMERRYRETDSSWVREDLGRYQNAKTCEVCDGARLNRLACERVAVDARAGNATEQRTGLNGPGVMGDGGHVGAGGVAPDVQHLDAAEQLVEQQGSLTVSASETA